jgi:hypothetical protein
MNIKFTKEALIEWIENIKEAARNDELFSIAWFKGTEKEPISIIAGWAEWFSDESESDNRFCVSKSNPRYIMCIKIAENEGPYLYTDYEVMNMPYNRETDEVDNTEILLEWDDPADYAAEYFMQEYETITKEYDNVYEV